MVSNLFGTWDTRESLLKSTLSAAISLLSANGEIVHQHTREVLQIQELLNGDWEVKLQHIYREGNKVVDFLAGLGGMQSAGQSFVAGAQTTVAGGRVKQSQTQGNVAMPPPSQGKPRVRARRGQATDPHSIAL
ncbi:hypothetical protein LINPERPRIM_LOCUS18909 [Linum perenne]